MCHRNSTLHFVRGSFRPQKGINSLVHNEALAIPHRLYKMHYIPAALSHNARYSVNLSICLSVCVYSGYIMHHYNGIWGTCAPSGRNMHLQGAMCTMVHKGDYIF